MAELTPGIKGTQSLTVDTHTTALAMQSGTLTVFATPAMVALMEKTAAQSVESLLDKGQTSVGTALEIKHVSASPVGANITCTSTLVKVDGRTLVFEVEAHDEAGLIGKGVHKRFIVNSEAFLAKTQSKLTQR